MLLLLNDLKQIEDNEKADSIDVLHDTIAAFENFFHKKHNLTSQDNKEHLVHAVLGLHGKYSQNMTLFHFINYFFLEWEKTANGFTSDVGLKFVEDYKNKWKDMTTRIASSAFNYIDFNNKTILLHGHNDVIVKLLTLAAERKYKIKIFQTEGRPKLEGKQQAKQLSNLDFSITYITDASIGRIMPEVDLVILGSESILPELFINKTGTYPIALAAHRTKSFLYVLADSRNILTNKSLPKSMINTFTTESLKSGDEVWDEPYSNVEPLNYYYDHTPNDLVDSFVLDIGAFTPEELSKYFENIEISDYFVKYS